MSGVGAVELSADCDACGLEGGVIEIYDALVAACRFGLPATSHCKLCSAAAQGIFEPTPAESLHNIPANRCPACLRELTQAAIDERCCASCGAHAILRETHPPIQFATMGDLEAALDAWAQRDKFPSRKALATATFVDPDVATLFNAIQKKQPLEILADPFANMGVRTTGSPRREKASPGPGDAPHVTTTSVAAPQPPLSDVDTPPEDTVRLPPIGDVPPPRAVPSSPLGALPQPPRGVGFADSRPSLGALPQPPRGVGFADSRPSLGALPQPPRGVGFADSRPSLGALPQPPRGVGFADSRPSLGALPQPPRGVGFADSRPSLGALPQPPRGIGFADSRLGLHEPPPASAPPRAIVYPIVSVIAADGEIHPAERALIDRFLQSEGLPPLTEDEFCVHHPSEVAHFVPRERREDVVKLMCETAAIDGMPDESERRVIRAYAAAWDVDDEKLEFWMWGYETINTSLTRQLWMKIRRFVLSARWSEEETARRSGGDGHEG